MHASWSSSYLQSSAQIVGCYTYIKRCIYKGVIYIKINNFLNHSTYKPIFFFSVHSRRTLLKEGCMLERTGGYKIFRTTKISRRLQNSIYPDYLTQHTEDRKNGLNTINIKWSSRWGLNTQLSGSLKVLKLFQWVILHEVTIIMLDVKMTGRNKSDFSL